MLKINQAMVLCAGLGSRMGDLTKDIPKPMLIVDGISLIERHLNYLFKNNIKKIVINTYYKAEIFEEFVRSLPISSKLDISFNREAELLGTGGGVKNALPLLEKDPFLVINNDAIFIDPSADSTAISQLESSWNPLTMPMMLLIIEKEKTFGYNGKGDFNLHSDGRITQENETRSFVNIGMSIMDYRVLENYPDKVLQFFPTIGKDLIQQQKLYGCVYKGDWYHIGDSKAYVESTELAFKNHG